MRFRVSKSTVHRWVTRSQVARLDRVDFGNKKTGVPKPKNKTPNKMEKIVLRIRKYLKEKSILGLHGANAIRDEMIRLDHKTIPSSRTITRILKRHGKIDYKKRVRHEAPPPGWYLPALADQQAELDSFDIVEGLYLRGGHEVQLLNGISLHGSLIHSQASDVNTAKITVSQLISHWRKFGLPKYVQFDNDMVFQGTRKPNALGQVIRVCLSLGVTPIFVTPYEQGFQGKIERFNGEIQQKFWRRKKFKNLKQVTTELEKYVFAHRLAHQDKIVTAPRRRKFPARWDQNHLPSIHGYIIYLRRTDGEGWVRILENDFLADEHWVNRLVRVVIDIDKGKIRFYRLRRKEPRKQSLIKTIKFNLKKKSKLTKQKTARCHK
jgi:hypothetical protein